MADTDVSPTAILAVLLLIFATLTLIRFVFVVFSMWSLAVGIGLALLLLRNYKLIPNLLLLLQITGTIKTPKTNYEMKATKQAGCTVCSKKGCKRQKEKIANLRPWESLQIPKPVDQALAEFFEITLKTHLYSWYWELSHDQGFVDEIRDMLRYALSVVVHRLQKTNLTDFILKKCLNKFLIHVDCFFRTKERGVQDTDIQTAMIERLRTYKHFAIQNDLAEEEYLRFTVQTIVPYLLPSYALDSNSCNFFLEELLSNVMLKPLVEKISEPDFVNHMLLIFLDKETIPEPNYPPSEKVEFLATFGKHRGSNATSALNVSSYDLIHQAPFLHPFMQFMKREGSLNVLQFCLEVEEFNKRSLAPELSEHEQVAVREKAQEINRNYFKTDGIDYIGFPDEVVKGFQDAISTDDHQGRLATATPLFYAYEFAVDILDRTYVPLFHQSEEYYLLLCGERTPSKKRIADTNLAKRKFMPLNQLSKITNKIKARKQQSRGSYELLNEQQEDYYDSPVEDAVDAYESQFNHGFVNDADEAHEAHGMRKFQEDEEFDLNFWHITIPKIDYESGENKKNFVFILKVEKLGNKESGSESSWQVVRKYNEFYVLHDKLRRFHDNFNEAELPTKRTILKKDFDYFNSVKFRLQDYLQKLVRSPILRGSSLLYSFLTPGQRRNGMFEPERFSREAERKVNSLKNKLVIEKGQNLESFLNSFLTSAEIPAKKKIPTKIAQQSPMLVHRRKDSRIYLPPPAWARKRRRSLSSSSDESHLSFHTHSVTDYILYAARNFFHVNSWVHTFLVCFQYVCKETVDAFVSRYLSYKLSVTTAEQQMVKYINLVRDVIFFDNDPPRTDSDKVERRDNTLAELRKFVPESIQNVIGMDNHDTAIKTLFELFQQPKLNRQLAYILLDEMLLELFPELKKPS